MLNTLTDTETFVETNQDYAYQCALTSFHLELKAIRIFEPGVMVETFVTNLCVKLYYASFKLLLAKHI